MEFTKIQGEEVVVPAKDAKVYDKLFIKNLRIISDVNGAKIIANLIPFNGEETLEEPITPLVIENIFADIQDENQPEDLRTLKAQVMEGVFQLTVAEMAYQKTKDVTNEEDNEEVQPVL